MVDPVGRREIREVLNRLTGTGVTVFLNSHLLSEVESFCEYVAILKRGQLALEGKISSLIAGVGYSIVASNLPEAAITDLKSSGVIIASHESGFELQAATREASNAVIDKVRGRRRLD